MDRCPVVHFDQHSTAYAEDPYGAYRQARQETPVFWTDAHGGFWVVTRFEDVAAAARDEETFSSFKDMNRTTESYSGVSIPPSPTRQLPIDLDPPLLQKHRKLLASRMAPPRARAMRPIYREWTDHFIDRFIETGVVEFVEQVATPVPTMATLAFLGLPLSDHHLYSGPFHDIAAYPKGTAGFARAVDGMAACMERVAEEVTDRRRHPRDDAISELVQGEIDGVPLSDEDVLDWIRLILGGGIDTTTSLIAHSLVYLDARPDLRQPLATDPKALSLFMEEMLRVATPTQALGRTATRDVELGGAQIREGDRVLLSWASANRDSRAFARPDDIQIDRTPNPHTSFGLGPHRCIGSHFARVEYLVVMERILTRLPDFRLSDRPRPYESIGLVNGWREVRATFSPGPSLDVPLRTSIEEVV